MEYSKNTSAHRISASEAFKKLKKGNQRFIENVRSIDSIMSQAGRKNLASVSQSPHTIILCCSDSRAPAEIVFDQGLGDLFVVRVAGNVIAPSIVGSVEFAALTFGTPLVVVMGHTKCGAVSATLEAICKRKKSHSENIQDIIQRIIPHVEGLMDRDDPVDRIMPEAVRANINAAVSELKHGSRALENLTRDGKLKIIGAEYCLESGKVEFFEEVKEAELGRENSSHLRNRVNASIPS